MLFRVPWFEDKEDDHYLPNEEYQVSRVGINENTGREEVLHYSLSENEFVVENDLDSIYLYPYGINNRFF